MANRALLDKENHCIFIACEGFQAEMWRVGMPQGRGRDGRTLFSHRSPGPRPPRECICAPWRHWWWRWLCRCRRGSCWRYWWHHPGCPPPEPPAQARRSLQCSTSCQAARAQAFTCSDVRGGLGWGRETHLETRTVTLPMMVGPTK